MEFSNGEKVYVLGGAQTDFERNWTKEGKNEIALLREVVTDALEDAHMTYDDIRKLNKSNRVACFVGNFIAEKYINQGHLGALLTEVDEAFYGVPSARYEAACASGSAALEAAMCQIRAGICDVSVVVGWELMKSVNAKTGAEILGYAAYYEKEAKGIAYPFPKLFEKLAAVTLKRYDLDEERYRSALAEIAAINYRNAKRNPLAQTRKWFMSYKEALNRGTETNALLGSRLAVSDCSQVTDGAAVVLLASENFVRARECLYGKSPVLKGFGHRTAPMLFDKKMAEAAGTPYLLPWTRQAVKDAYERAGMTAESMDFFEVHDCFTSSEYAAISALGIAEPGKEYEAVEDGRIEFTGTCPINPSGGLIGCGHPVGATGVRMFLDLYRQVSGNAGGYQIKNAANGLMLNIGGTATTNYVFIVGREEISCSLGKRVEKNGVK